MRDGALGGHSLKNSNFFWSRGKWGDMGRGGLNIWHEYRLFCGSTQWLLVQSDTYATFHAALQKKFLNNKNTVLLTPKFALSFFHTSNLSSKLLQSKVEYFNQFQPIPTQKLSDLSRFSYESLAEQFCPYTAHMLKDRVPVPWNVLASSSLGWQVGYSAEGESYGSCFQQFIQREQQQLKRPIMPLPKWLTALSPCPIAMKVVKAFLEDRELWLPSGRGADLNPDSLF